MDISIFIALGAGMASFLSPCVLPMVPVYLAILAPAQTGLGTGQLRAQRVRHSLLFVLGFSVVFTLLGAAAGLTGYAVSLNTTLLHRIAGILLVFFGLFLLAALFIPRLNIEKRFAPAVTTRYVYLRSFLIGAVFSLGWTPCIGPILAGILTIASVKATAWLGASLLLIYSLGLGIPFLIIGASFDFLTPFLKRLYRLTPVIQVISGVLLITIGVLFLAGKGLWLATLLT